MNKQEWKAKGKKLGERASKHSWEIGQWLADGQHLFIEPAPEGKRKRRRWFAAYREMLRGFIAEASRVTGLSEHALAQIRRVVKNGAKVEEVSFSHHIEVQRVRKMNEKGQWKFDWSAATEILNLAKEKKWTVRETREEVQRRYPTAEPPAAGESLIDSAKRRLLDIFESISDVQDCITVAEALIAELNQVKEKYEKPPIQSNEFETQEQLY